MTWICYSPSICYNSFWICYTISHRMPVAGQIVTAIQLLYRLAICRDLSNRYTARSITNQSKWSLGLSTFWKIEVHEFCFFLNSRIFTNFKTVSHESVLNLQQRVTNVAVTVIRRGSVEVCRWWRGPDCKGQSRTWRPRPGSDRTPRWPRRPDAARDRPSLTPGGAVAPPADPAPSHRSPVRTMITEN